MAPEPPDPTSRSATGHWPTLLAAFLYFDAAFMVWVLLGPLAPTIAVDLRLGPAAVGTMIAVPTLAGALLRPLAGVALDRFGAKRTGAAGQLVVIAGLAFAWAIGIHGYAGLLALGLLLGVAGASFAVALPLAGGWYPPARQGLVQGVAGMGNSGTVLAALFAPPLAVAFGWRAVLGLACLPLAGVLLAYLLLARDPPRGPRIATGRSLMRERDCRSFQLLYAVTFGGFVGLASSLPILFALDAQADPVTAGRLAALCVLAGSVARPLGGIAADRIGGTRALAAVILAAAIALAGAAAAAGTPAAVVLLALAMLMLGAGNGALFQLVPQRYGARAGEATGLIGMAGGLGGFALAAMLGVVRQSTGSYAPGLLLFALAALTAWLWLLRASRVWRKTWIADARI